jgi:hypothetical protein
MVQTKASEPDNEDEAQPFKADVMGARMVVKSAHSAQLAIQSMPTQTISVTHKAGVANQVKTDIGSRLHPAIQRRGVASPVIQFGLFDHLGPVNPRLYLPTWLGGHSYAHLTERQQTRDANLPQEVKGELASAYRVVSADQRKTRPDQITVEEHQEIIELLEGIHAGSVNVRISPELSKPEYAEGEEEHVREQLHTETLKDLVKITQTTQGRALLKKLSARPEDDTNNAVFIKPTDVARPPDASPISKPLTDLDYQKRQRSYAQYTPTSIITNDETALGEYGKLARTNPWVVPGRADVALFHELVHTDHIQTGTLLPKSRLIDADEFPTADPLDLSGEGRTAVPEEEYKTVGLDKYADEEFTDNKYRAERRDLGEHVPHRGYYSHH